MNGFAICKLLKQNVLTRRIPVIFMSGRVGLDDKLEGFAAGGVDYITKPCAQAEVLTRVRTHIQIKQRMEALEAAASLHVMESAGVCSDPDELLFSKAANTLKQCLTAPLGHKYLHKSAPQSASLTA
jgi:DNA-binding response OmpR family regulator